MSEQKKSATKKTPQKPRNSVLAMLNCSTIADSRRIISCINLLDVTKDNSCANTTTESDAQSFNAADAAFAS
jgi:hypothetical protein